MDNLTYPAETELFSGIHSYAAYPAQSENFILYTCINLLWLKEKHFYMIPTFLTFV